jgi:predicted transcriptional regulator
VHTDVKALEDLGIIERDSEGRVTVPWDEVEVKVPLAA